MDLPTPQAGKTTLFSSPVKDDDARRGWKGRQGVDHRQ